MDTLDIGIPVERAHGGTRGGLHLNLFIHGPRATMRRAWRHPAGVRHLPLSDIRYYADLARQAEAGVLSIPSSWADTLAAGDGHRQARRGSGWNR